MRLTEKLLRIILFKRKLPLTFLTDVIVFIYTTIYLFVC